MFGLGLGRWVLASTDLSHHQATMSFCRCTHHPPLTYCLLWPPQRQEGSQCPCSRCTGELHKHTLAATQPAQAHPGALGSQRDCLPAPENRVLMGTEQEGRETLPPGTGETQAGFLRGAPQLDGDLRFVSLSGTTPSTVSLLSAGYPLAST